MSKQEQEQEQKEQIPLIYAKSMTGHIYAYAVRTVGEFKQRVATDYDVSVTSLRLLDMEEQKEEQEQEQEQKETNETLLRENTVYALFMDKPSQPTLLPWIVPLTDTLLNPALAVENPMYVLTEQEAVKMDQYTLDYLSFHTPYIEVLESQLYRLSSENGWRRLFTNKHAIPLLERTYSQGIWHEHFAEHAPLLAINEHPDTHLLLLRLLDDPTVPPIRRPDIFWRNVAQFQPHALAILDHPAGPGHLSHLDHFCENPVSVSYFFPLPLFLTPLDPRIRWRSLVRHRAAAPHLLPYLENGFFSPMTSPCHPHCIFYNPSPLLVPYYRTLPLSAFKDGGWDILCKHAHPTILAFIEENVEHLTPDAWKVLNRNPEAISLLQRHPHRIHWTLFCTNPSPHVIPLVEEYLALHEEAGFAPFISSEIVSMLGKYLLRDNILERYQLKPITDNIYSTIINLGALSLHPHALPLLERRPELIYANSFSLRPDIYLIPKGTLL